MAHTLLSLTAIGADQEGQVVTVNSKFVATVLYHVLWPRTKQM